MKTENIQKEQELNDEQLDNATGGTLKPKSYEVLQPQD